MNRADIIRLARDAELIVWEVESQDWKIVESMKSIELFAALVAATEREACARVCDKVAERNKHTAAHVGWVLGNVECADAIRAKGNSHD